MTERSQYGNSELELLKYTHEEIDKHKYILEQCNLSFRVQEEIERYGTFGKKTYFSKVVVKIYNDSKQNEFESCIFIFLYYQGKALTENDISELIKLEFESVAKSLE